jgi:hypothetical protein
MLSGMMDTARYQTMLKAFDAPDEVREFKKGLFEIVRIAGSVVGRATYQPGWRWSIHVGPMLGRKGVMWSIWVSFLVASEQSHMKMVESSNCEKAMSFTFPLNLTTVG